MTHPFMGAGVALITPFNEDKSIDYKALERLIENQVQGGIDYMVVLGTTGETPTLSENEKKEIVRFVIDKNAGRLKIVVGMGGNNTSGLVESIQNANFDGVDAILSVTPYYSKPTQEGLFQHFKIVVEASPVPVILYNVPGRTGVNMDADTTLRIGRLSDKVVAVKEASGDLGQFARIISKAPSYFKLISGDDGLTLPSIAIGSIGVISVIANALPEKLSQLTHTSLHGDTAVSGQLHLQMAEMLKLIFKEGSPCGVKALMEIMGIAKNQLRLPLVPVSPATYTLIEEQLKQIK
ncbi:MAG: 4-hydroxy-tetrahydrodipicolinate synthase [Bacteroidota bacterium]|nr:4-hydroxy-tetrahydrodipicolinate synthase [Odoribacter sp.]MDP3644011.1 4-hydroxy-tetrahydrodipicolinate synthase [Bacteroidota bacterium]